MARPRKSPPLPAPFDSLDVRLDLRRLTHICENTICRWAEGSQRVDEHRCRSLVAACLVLGIVPPVGAKTPAPIGAVPAPKPAIRAVS